MGRDTKKFENHWDKSDNSNNAQYTNTAIFPSSSNTTTCSCPQNMKYTKLRAIPSHESSSTSSSQIYLARSLLPVCELRCAGAERVYFYRLALKLRLRRRQPEKVRCPAAAQSVSRARGHVMSERKPSVWRCCCHQRWADCRILRSSPEFLKPSPNIVQNVFQKWSSIKSKKLTKYSFLTTRMLQFFSKSGPDPKFLKRFTVRIQSEFKQVRYSPDQVQSNAHLWLPRHARQRIESNEPEQPKRKLFALLNIRPLHVTWLEGIQVLRVPGYFRGVRTLKRSILRSKVKELR